MTAVKLLRDQFNLAHEWLEGTMQGVDESIAHKDAPGVAHNIASSYAHIIASEDMIMNGVLQGKPSFNATSWKGKTGMSEPQPTADASWEQNYSEWAKKVRINLDELREYGKLVQEETDKYIGNLRDVDLDKEIDLNSMGMGMGMVTVGWIISNFIIAHIHNMMGEISALKGVQGFKGYPF